MASAHVAALCREKREDKSRGAEEQQAQDWGCGWIVGCAADKTLVRDVRCRGWAAKENETVGKASAIAHAA
jgi:hypothetical protein